MPACGFRSSSTENVFAVDFNALGFFERDRTGLVRRLVEHGREPEEFSGRRLIDHHFLVIFVYRRYPDGSRNQNVGAASGIADAVNALPGSEPANIHLAGEDSCLVIVQ